MNNYIPQAILVPNEEDGFIPSKSMNVIFEWANTMGLQGKKIYDLKVIETYALNTGKELWCKVACTDDERLRWENFVRSI